MEEWRLKNRTVETVFFFVEVVFILQYENYYIIIRYIYIVI